MTGIIGITIIINIFRGIFKASYLFFYFFKHLTKLTVTVK